MDRSIRLNVLGPCQLASNDAPISVSSYHFGLLSIFALKRLRTIGRTEVASLLWSDVSSSRARHSLSQLVYSLNQAVGMPLVTGNRANLVLASISVDIDDFRAAVAASDWVEASRLYRGELLQGLSLRRAAGYEEWIAGLRLDYAESAISVIEALRLEGQASLASALAARLPMHLESVTREPDSHHASQSARGSLPGPDELRIGGSTRRRRFVGRAEELSRLEYAFSTANSRGFRILLIEGEPGVGKSALIDRFSRMRAIRGSFVLVAEAFEAEQNVPLGIVAQWVRELGERHISALTRPLKEVMERAFGTGGQGRSDDGNPSLYPSAEASSQFRLLEAVRQLLLSASTAQPLVLILDDANWADPASLGFIHYFFRRSPDARVLLLASARLRGPNPSIPFGGWKEVERLRLDPLSMRETARLLEDSGSEQAPLVAESLADFYSRTGGNPLLIVSLLEARSDPGTTDIPASVVEFFTPRLAQLTEEASLLLAAIAVGGHEIDLELAARISGLSDSVRSSAALRELEVAALVMCDANGKLRPRHGIVAEVAISRIAGVRRRALFGRAARILREEGQSPSVLAVKHDIGGDRTHAFEAAVKAAAASRDLHATREREFFLKLALSNAPSSNADAQIRIELSGLLADLGRPSEALDIVRDELVSGAPAALRSSAKAIRLAVRLRKVDVATDLRLVWDEIETLTEHLEPAIVADLYYHLAAAAHDLGRVGDALAGAQHALAVAQELPKTSGSALVAARSAVVIALYLGVEHGLTVIDRLLPEAESDIEALAQCLGARGTVLVTAGRLIEAESAFLRGVELMERCCLYGSLFGLHNNLGVCYMERGRFTEARKQFEEAARFGREFSAPSDAAIADDNIALLLLEEGNHRAALEIARNRPSDGANPSARWLFGRHGIIGLCALELGLLASAFEAKREIELLFDQHEYWGSDVSYVETFLARMLVLEDRVDEARERLEKAIEVYRPRDLLCRSRLELELARIELKHDPVAALARSEKMLETLRGTGARPLIDRFDELADRARRRHPA